MNTQSFSDVRAAGYPMVSSGWWRNLGSNELNGIVASVIAANPDLSAASLRVLQSELELSNTHSRRLPSATVGAGATVTSATDATGGRDTQTSGNLSTSVVWEADLWGRIAREGDVGAANLLATSYDRDALANSLIASVVRNYVTVAYDRREIAATRRIIENRQTSLEITQQRFGRGVEGTTAGTVKSAEENLAAARADLPSIELSLIESSNAIAVLAGRVPTSRRNLRGQLPARLPAIDFSIGTPLILLDRRPDIRGAAARLKAANANIAVSVADRFPSLTLNGSLRSSGDSLETILDLDNVVASLANDLLLTVFDAGRGSRIVSIRRAQAEERAADYVATVLDAIQDVEDALAGERLLAERSRLLSIRLQAAREATSIARDRYSDGTGSYLTLLDASRSEAAAETAFLAVEQSRWLNRVDLILALGGGWSAASTNSGSST